MSWKIRIKKGGNKEKYGKFSDKVSCGSQEVHRIKRSPIKRKFREMKIFKILSHTYRNPKEYYSIKTINIAGLVNLKNGF